MKLIKHVQDLEISLIDCHNQATEIGFVPTMGALHSGHLALIKKSKAENKLTVCSIFVNPTQFNNLIDLQKYPITLEKDIDKLEKAGCDIVFLPTVQEMYPENEPLEKYELGVLETILEGSFRPGHFQGVCIIVDKLLKTVKPTALYMGQKDYQQCMVIKKMVVDKNYPITLHICDTIREADGLAMSSRNSRLNGFERQKATNIIETLNFIKLHIKKGNIVSIKKEATEFLEKQGYKVNYTEIADANTLELLTEWDGKKKLVALVAAYLNEIRLIDNLLL